MNSDITAQELRRVLDYNPSTGIFTRRTPHWLAGATAGFVGARGYVKIRIGRHQHLAHRLAWLYHYGAWPTKIIDHIDGCPSNNAIANLRDCSQSNNMMNRRKQKNNTSGFTGVSGHHARSKTSPWRAAIKVNGKSLVLGYFRTPEDAHAAYVAAARKYFGEYANKPAL